MLRGPSSWRQKFFYLMTDRYEISLCYVKYNFRNFRNFFFRNSWLFDFCGQKIEFLGQIWKCWISKSYGFLFFIFEHNILYPIRKKFKLAFFSISLNFLCDLNFSQIFKILPHFFSSPPPEKNLMTNLKKNRAWVYWKCIHLQIEP